MLVSIYIFLFCRSCRWGLLVEGDSFFLFFLWGVWEGGGVLMMLRNPHLLK